MSASEPAARRRALSARRWALVVALALVGLAVALLGVAFLVEAEPCGCSPIPPSPSPDLTGS